MKDKKIILLFLVILLLIFFKTNVKASNIQSSIGTEQGNSFQPANSISSQAESTNSFSSSNSQSSLNTASTLRTNSTVIQSVNDMSEDQSAFRIGDVLNVLLIAVGFVLILFAIAILIRLK